jgi:mono/diheme cytochrome c family protein
LHFEKGKKAAGVWIVPKAREVRAFILRTLSEMRRPSHPSPLLRASAFCAGGFLFFASAAPLLHGENLAAKYTADIQPLLKKYCNDCHNADEFKGDLDLARFTTFDAVMKDAPVWQGVVEQMMLGEMPPKKKPQPDAAERDRLLAWVNAALDEAAMAHAGDPGPVVLRRLNNAEFNFTVRDLTGVESLDPAKEFPADSAAGEGFMNTGNALVMSPSLVSKYLDAGKEIAAHAVFLPDGMVFSPATSQRDWTEERLAAIRAFYGKYTEAGGGQAVNLQGIKFDTNGGGILPLAKYFLATIEEKSGSEDVAKKRGLSPKYLAMLWVTLNDTKPSILLDPLRARWRVAKPGDVPSLVAEVNSWQRALWKFSTIGHIGKRDGPKAWQEPVTPVAASRDIKVKLGAQDTTLFLTTTDAGDGAENDAAIWKNPRLVMPGRADIPLRDVRSVAAGLAAQKQRVFSSAAKCLEAAMDKGTVAELAQKHGLDAAALGAWMEVLGLGGSAKIESYITTKSDKSGDYSFVKGWTGADALSVVANSSDQEVRVPGTVKPHSVVAHPSPSRRVAVGWRAATAANLRVSAMVKDAHTDCGNGVSWWLEVRRGSTRQTLSTGNTEGSKDYALGPFENVAVQPGDLVSIVIGPRDGSHVCDLTALDITLNDGTREWNLAREISPDILAGNPHADAQGNANVWHFYSEPDKGGASTALPADSVLAKWQSATDGEAKRRFAAELERMLVNNGEGLAKDSPDAALVKQLTSLRGPLLSALITNLPKGTDAGDFGLAASEFSGNDIAVKGASVLEVKLPADLADGCEFVATAAVLNEGSVQMQALTKKPAATQGIVAGANVASGTKGTWSDGDKPVVSDTPVLVADGSAARRRIEASFDEFRALFPATLCYTKIVPVDEVVTLTLFYREDEHLRRLVLNDAESAELDRLWSELHFVSHDAFKLVDAFEQLWQFATQDADPSAFTPMREPIQKKAAEFRETLTAAEPRHVAAVIDFAKRAWRRPTTESEREELRALYKKLREQELPHDAALRMLLARVFVAPAFLYKMEKPAPDAGAAPVTDWELASRLSYFLWSSQPDAELLKLAAEGRLQDPDVLAAQARRMLGDARVRRLATEFGCAWLHIHDFASLDEKSEQHFPEFAALKGAMYEEAIRNFTDLFQSNRPVLSLLDADFTFANEALAKFYGIPMKGGDWQRVDGVRKFGRGGILTQAAVLAKQSGASRTSPILRGNWLCETLLGEKLPRPPKGVPTLPETPPQGLTERQITEKHSTDPNCAGCHIRIDPYGYAMEAYDAIGRHRVKDTAGLAIDTRTKIRSGAEFDGIDGLRTHLLEQRRDAVALQFTKKLLGYALGRSVLLSDKPLLREITSKDRTAGEVVEAIVRSRQFREIRGTKN